MRIESFSSKKSSIAVKTPFFDEFSEFAWKNPSLIIISSYIT